MRRLISIFATGVLALLCVAALSFQALASEPSTTPTTGLERLALLAEYIDDVPAGSLNMFSWGNGEESTSASFRGCLAGHATALFANQGFTMGHDATGARTVKYQGHGSIPACEAFFAVTRPEAEHLFAANGHDTPHEVSSRVRKFVADHGGPLSRGPLKPSIAYQRIRTLE